MSGDDHIEDDRTEREKNAEVSSANTYQLTVIGHSVESGALFGGRREIIIVHGREHYHLRITSQNKLILTK
jgi:hemin uptake protein HemP